MPDMVAYTKRIYSRFCIDPSLTRCHSRYSGSFSTSPKWYNSSLWLNGSDWTRTYKRLNFSLWYHSILPFNLKYALPMSHKQTLCNWSRTPATTWRIIVATTPYRMCRNGSHLTNLVVEVSGRQSFFTWIWASGFDQRGERSKGCSLDGSVIIET